MIKRFRLFAAVLALYLSTVGLAHAQVQGPAACPTVPVEVLRSRGGVIDYLGSVPGIPDLCRMRRSGETGDYYYGVWRTDWPGAGDAYPAIKAVMLGGASARSSFITRSAPGMQWVDTFINEGLENLEIDGRRYLVLRIVHERNGIEGNTYHSLITSWRDVKTGIGLQTYEQQISGQSYGPDTTWRAITVSPLPTGDTPAS